MSLPIGWPDVFATATLDGTEAVQVFDDYYKARVTTSGALATFAASGRRLEEFGTVDNTGATDMSALINAAIISTAAAGETLLIGAGRYRLDSAIVVRSNMRLEAASNARFTAYYNATGSNGVVQTPSASAAVTQATREHHIYIKGGIWGYDGVSPTGTDTDWEGNYYGNVFSLFCDDMTFDQVTVEGYGPNASGVGSGRAWTIAGDRVFMMDCQARKCYGGGGAGGIRYIGGTTFRCTDAYVVSGDDLFQLVPGGVVTSVWGNLDIRDAIYANSQGISIEGRVIALGLTTQDRVTTRTLSASITNVATTIPLVSGGNTLAIGMVLTTTTTEQMVITAINSNISVTVQRGYNGTSAAAVTLPADSATLSVDTEERTLTLSASITSGATTIPLTFGGNSLAAGNVIRFAATGELAQVVSVASDTSITVTRSYGGTTAGAVTLPGDSAYLTSYTDQFQLTCTIADCAFIGIIGEGGGSSFTIQNSDSIGAIERISFIGCVIDDANNDDRPMAVTILGRLGGVKDVYFKDLYVRGSYRQIIDAAGTIDGLYFDGGAWLAPRSADRSPVRFRGVQNGAIRNVNIYGGSGAFDVISLGSLTAFDNPGLMSRGPVENIVIEGNVIHDVQNDQYAVVASYGENVQVVANRVYAGTGVTTARGAGFGAALTNAWVDRNDFSECLHATPVLDGGVNIRLGSNLGVTNYDMQSQSAAGGSLAWRPRLRKVRVNVAGTVTSITGTPTETVRFTIHSVVNGTVIQNNSTMLLSGSANATLDIDETLTLEWAPADDFWIEVGRMQR